MNPAWLFSRPQLQPVTAWHLVDFNFQFYYNSSLHGLEKRSPYYQTIKDISACASPSYWMTLSAQGLEREEILLYIWVQQWRDRSSPSLPQRTPAIHILGELLETWEIWKCVRKIYIHGNIFLFQQREETVLIGKLRLSFIRGTIFYKVLDFYPANHASFGPHIVL